MATVIDERALDERLARLEAARPWSPRVVSRLESLIRDGDDAALFRVNPFTFAAERGLDPPEAIDLMLHATAEGLFEMDWLLICPRCACAVESFARLRSVMRQFRCPQCHNDYEATMDDYIAIYFNVSPQIRDRPLPGRRRSTRSTTSSISVASARVAARTGRPTSTLARDALRDRLPGAARLGQLRIRRSTRLFAGSARTRRPASRCRSPVRRSPRPARSA